MGLKGEEEEEEEEEEDLEEKDGNGIDPDSDDDDEEKKDDIFDETGLLSFSSLAPFDSPDMYESHKKPSPPEPFDGAGAGAG